MELALKVLHIVESKTEATEYTTIYFSDAHKPHKPNDKVEGQYTFALCFDILIRKLISFVDAVQKS